MLTSKQLARYRSDICAFAEEQFYLPETKKPIVLEPHQKRILADVFTPGPDGRFPYQTIIYSCPKKSGKTTIAALVCLWYALTQEPPNELYIAANDFEQAQSRVYRTLCKAIELNLHLRAGAEVKARSLRFPATDTIVVPLASEYASAAGSNHGLTCWDELWGYISESSRRLYEELTPVPTRKNSLRLITTYAGWEGESDLLLDIYKRGMAGRRLHDDLPVWTDGDLYLYWDHEARMPWQTPEYYEAQRKELRANAYLRLHENRWTTNADAFIDMDAWRACEDAERAPLLTSNGAPLFVGVDASVKHDSAAVVATYYDYDVGKVVLAKHRVWQPSPQEPLDLEATIEEYLHELFVAFPLEVVRYDPFQFHRSATTLAADGLPMEEFPQTVPNLTAMGQNLFELVKHSNLVLYPDDDLRKAASQAVAIETTRGFRIAKEKTSHKIDVIIALAMSALAAVGEGYFGPSFEEEYDPGPDEYELEGAF